MEVTAMEVISRAAADEPTKVPMRQRGSFQHLLSLQCEMLSYDCANGRGKKSSPSFHCLCMFSDPK